MPTPRKWRLSAQVTVRNSRALPFATYGMMPLAGTVWHAIASAIPATVDHPPGVRLNRRLSESVAPVPARGAKQPPFGCSRRPATINIGAKTHDGRAARAFLQPFSCNRIVYQCADSARAEPTACALLRTFADHQSV